MKLKTVKHLFVFSKFMLCAALIGLIVFVVFYAQGRVEFKYISLPVMACFISVTWLGSTKAAIRVMEQEQEEEEA